MRSPATGERTIPKKLPPSQPWRSCVSISQLQIKAHRRQIPHGQGQTQRLFAAGRQPVGDAPRAALLHRPQAAVEQALLAVVAQADQLVAGRRHLVVETAAFPHSHIVGAARGVAADQDLIGLEHALRIEIALGDHLRVAVAAGLEIVAGADVHRQADNRIALGLPVHLGQHRVRLGLGEEAAALDRRQLRRIAQHQERHAERQQVAAQLGIDHRAFVDDDQLGLGGGRLVPQVEVRHFLAALSRAVDQAVDGGGAVAALAAHHARRLAGEGGELHLAVDMLGEMREPAYARINARHETPALITDDYLEVERAIAAAAQTTTPHYNSEQKCNAELGTPSWRC